MYIADNTKQDALGISELLSDRISDIGKFKFNRDLYCQLLFYGWCTCETWLFYFVREVCRVGGAHICLAPTVSQDYR